MCLCARIIDSSLLRAVHRVVHLYGLIYGNRSHAAPPKLYACLSYRNPATAIEFLMRAFGFVTVLIVHDDDGAITHAEIALGQEIVMLGSSKPELGWISPLDLPAVNSTICAFVPDVDAHCARTLSEGATLLRPLADTSYGAREYSVKDLEGHHWHFGTYRPTATPSPNTVAS